MDRYIGLDAQASSCTVAILGPSGRRLASHVVETNARALISTIDTIPRQRRLCLEEGALADWLHEVLAPHVQEMVVTAARKHPGAQQRLLGHDEVFVPVPAGADALCRLGDPSFIAAVCEGDQRVAELVERGRNPTAS